MEKLTLTSASFASKSVLWNHKSENLTSLGCDKAGKFAFIVHGWLGSESSWAPILVENLLKYRGGCVIYINWGAFAESINYFTVIFKNFEEM